MFLILIPFIAALLSIFVRKKVWQLEAITVVAAILELVAAILIVIGVVVVGYVAIGSDFYVDALGALLVLIIAVVGFAASMYSVGYLRAEVKKQIIGFRRVRQYFVLLHLFLMVMFFAVTTSNPIMMWIAIEATTLSTAFLISFYNKPSAMEAAWKYLMINSIGLLLAFFGTLLYLTSVDTALTAGFVDWKLLFESASNLDPVIAKIAFIFILIGYGTKVGLAPMHTWLPDAHSKAPAPISSLLSGVLLNVAFLAVLRFKIITGAAVGTDFVNDLLIGFGMVSIGVAAFIIFIQKNYKRLLAYSSIEHMGIMAVGVGFGGIGTFGALLHMLYHSLTKSLLFLSAGNIFLKFSSTKIEKVRGVLSVLPVTGIFFLIGFLAISGIPPFGIFLSEFYVVSAGIIAHPVATIFVLLFLAIAFVGLLKNISPMIWGEAPATEKGESSYWTILPPVALIIILVVLSIYIPEPLKALLAYATLTLQ